MDTESLELFVLAAKRLNISAAGRELGLAPAVASARLAKLEKILNSELLHRSTRKVSLSLEGEEFLPFAKEMLAQERAALDALGQRQSEPSGTLRFAASSTFAQLYVAPLLPAFLDKYPQIDLDLRLSDDTHDLIEGSFDLALRNQVLKDSSLKARKLASDTRVLCASPAYLSQRGKPQVPEDLEDHALIGFQGKHARVLSGRDGVSASFDPRRADCRLVLDDGYSLKLASLAGAGISINSLWSVQSELESGELVRVLPDYVADEDTDIWLVYPKSNILTPKVRVFIDYLVSEIRQHVVFASSR